MGRRAAFFDLDHTLIDADAGVLLGLSLAKVAWVRGEKYSGPVRAGYYAYVGSKMASRFAQGAFFTGLAKAKVIKRSTHVKMGYRMLEGVSAREMSERMGAIWEERLRNLFYPKMLALVQKHREAGDRLVVVTTALRPLVEHAKKYLGEDVDIIAVDPVAEKGVWSGRVEGPLYGAEKRKAVEGYAKENDVDLAESTAYSDHWSDVAFLESVGHPVAVNPSVRLALLAKRRGWRVLRVTR